MSCLCFRKKKVQAVPPSEISNIMNSHQSPSSKVPDDSTLAVMECITPLILPVICRAVSKQLIADGSLLINEEKITTYDENCPDEDLPIGPIEINIEDVVSVDAKTLQLDMMKAPDFQWPEKDNVEAYIKKVPGKGRRMIVLDLENIDLLIPFGEGVEISFPVSLPLFNGEVEVGYGGDIKKAWIRLEMPKLRVWIVSATKKCYLAFMDMPQLTPHLHVNADRGNGDFLSIYLTENGSLDNVVETVMAGFGPNLKRDSDSKDSDWIGDAVGGMLSGIIQKSMGIKKGQDNMPYELDLAEAIDGSIDIALGKPRPVDVVKENIKLLEKELELAMEAEKKKK